ncbi:MAG TPA: hypothetical protein PLU30_27510 [Verrucomicrobiae bacterium]|nr:hypothetical protein [Verrucomicrobiae bacterium]
MKTATRYFARGSVEWDELGRWWDGWTARFLVTLIRSARDKRIAPAVAAGARQWMREQRQ